MKPFDAMLLTMTHLFLLPAPTPLEADRGPACERNIIADGVKDYNDIANMFYPEANNGVYNYR